MMTRLSARPSAGSAAGPRRFLTGVLTGALVAGLLAGAAPAHAQGFFQQINDTRLQKSDYDAIGDVTRKILDAQEIEPGAIEPWTNAETGAKGVAELVSASTDAEGRTCRTVKQIFQTRAMKSPAAYQARHCRQADGSWKLAE